MNYRAMALALGLAIALVAQSGSDSAAIGTWKQDLAKSKYNPGPARATPATLKIEAVQGGERVSVESSDDEGKPTSYSYTATYDGKPTPVTGSPYGDSVSLKRSNSNESTITYTRNGKLSRTSIRKVSKDGRTLTVTAKGTTASGQQYNNMAVFTKQ